MVQDTWPLSTIQNDFSIDNWETDSVREAWNTKASSLFCVDEDDMLVERGTIFSYGKHIYSITW